MSNKKQLTKKETILPILLDEIITEIFSRTPAKSVGKFRSLSKTWYANLSTSHFINLHISRKSHQESLILWSSVTKSLNVINPPIKNPNISKKIKLGRVNNGPVRSARFVGSSNGLVLVVNSNKDLILVNPLTVQLFKVPSLDCEKNLLLTLHGFGYDSVSKDYKIVAVCCWIDEFELRKEFSTYLYSFKLGVWRRIHQESFHEPDTFWNLCGSFANGAYHWTFNRGRKVGILAFNMSTEVFHEVEVPLDFPSSYNVCGLFSGEGNLCAYSKLRRDGNMRLNGRIDLWMMKEYGKVSSWTKLGSVDENRNWPNPRLVYFGRDVGSVLVFSEKRMSMCHLGEGIVKDVVDDGGPACFDDGCSFVGSLISLEEIMPR